MSEAFTGLGESRYIYLTHFRKDGTPVGIPIWFVRDDDHLAVWVENADTWKVKRMRRNPNVTVADCDVRGNHRGPEIAATAEVLDLDGTQRVRSLIAAKYGLSGRFALYANRLFRGKNASVGIAIRCANASTST
ncbi:PPOX class F420-dependent oxidoreductase [Nocardia sp. NPDC051030]|uniref:PPOX class F420-dependent oxidoreductase n=1 Tax=Nocardia sp. NPDC051030 TaxID=3155162 RepID=UPI0034346E32